MRYILYKREENNGAKIPRLLKIAALLALLPLACGDGGNTRSRSERGQGFRSKIQDLRERIKQESQKGPQCSNEKIEKLNQEISALIAQKGNQPRRGQRGRRGGKAETKSHAPRDKSKPASHTNRDRSGKRDFERITKCPE